MLNNKVIITGAAGFIGSHMCELMLKKKFEIIGIDDLSNGTLSNLKKITPNKKFIFMKKNLLDLKILDFKK